jgi:hypothetical protein
MTEHPHVTWLRSLKPGDKVRYRVTIWGAVKEYTWLDATVLQAPKIGPRFTATEQVYIEIHGSPVREHTGKQWVHVNSIEKPSSKNEPYYKAEVRATVSNARKIIRNEIKKLISE